MRHLLIGLSALVGATASIPDVAMATTVPKTFSNLVEDVMPAVVNISTAQNAPQTSAGLPTGRDGVSLGSGFIVDPSGIVVTNNHVIENADTITVTLESGEEYDAVLRGVDRETDLAVLQITADRRFPAVQFGNSDRASVGDWVVAIGQPFGLGGSVSAGIVSARNRDINSGLYDDYIQTDAAINRGNSGGPLFAMDGQVIGVNTIIYSRTGGSVGVGFAVPSNLANRIVNQLIQFGETRRGFLGVLLNDVTADDQGRLGLASLDGALVTGVPTAGGPAQLAGIQMDDVIIRFGTRRIEDRRDLTRAVADTDVGTTVPVQLIRAGQRQTVRVKIAQREIMTAMRPGTIETSGLTLESASVDVTELYGLSPNTAGVVVTNVDPRSRIADVIQPGDVILEIAFNPVRDAEGVENYLNQLRQSGTSSVQVLVRRGDLDFYAHITP